MAAVDAVREALQDGTILPAGVPQVLLNAYVPILVVVWPAKTDPLQILTSVLAQPQSCDAWHRAHCHQPVRPPRRLSCAAEGYLKSVPLPLIPSRRW